ncbi:MAG: hypothetical protein F6K21_17385 [Symploca sp. SIO2D2]|nr:hypothetical protein [Symploca sp. SIO2D2]
MVKLFHKIALAAVGTTLLTGLVGDRAEAYEFFTNRNEWLEAVQSKPISLEDFNSIPDGIYEEGELPTDVFTNLEPSPAFPIGVKLSEGELVRVPNRDFTVQMDFSKGVWGVGLDVITEEELYQYELVGFNSSGEELFKFFGDDGDFEFIGWVAEEDDLPAFRTDVFFDFGRELSWDNLVVAEEPDNTSVPEGGSGVIIGLVFLGCISFFKKNLVQLG